MHIASSSLALAALPLIASAGVIYAEPDSAVMSKTHKLDQIYAGDIMRVGPIAHERALLKYKGTVPKAVSQAALAAKQMGHVNATDEQYDSSYITPFQVGGKTFKMDIDTGSSDFWLLSTSLPANEQGKHNLYSPSSASQLSGETWTITYGDQSGAEGVVYADKVAVGGVSVTEAAVEAATSVSSEFVSEAQDGLAGFAFGSINQCSPNKCKTFFNILAPSLPLPLFTAALRKGKPGTYTFGYIDKSLYTGNIAYANVNTANGFWQFLSGGYAVGNGAKQSTTIHAIADTGTSLAFLPDEVLDGYYSQVDGAEIDPLYEAAVFPCSSALPTFSLYMGGARHTIPGNYLNYAPLDDGTGRCYGGLQSNEGLDGLSIVGDSFLKGQYVVFDTRGPKIGFAQQA